MLLPSTVELANHNPAWARAAAAEAARLTTALGPVLLACHHIGSTAIPGIKAKPILDLLPVVRSLAELDQKKENLEAIGFNWWGENGLAGRRYLTKDDLRSGARTVQLHCYQVGSSEIDRHIALRDYLREMPEIAAAYQLVKMRCRDLHRDNSHAYGACKAAWIDTVEAAALRVYKRTKYASEC